MKEYIHLLSKNNKKYFIFYSIKFSFSFAETFSVTLIPLFIDYIVNQHHYYQNILIF